MGSGIDDTDYAASEAHSVDALKKVISAKYKQGIVPESMGMFVELFEDNYVPDHYVATATDTGGTKTILAQAMGKYDTVGVGYISVLVNDFAAHPGNGWAFPRYFLNTMLTQAAFREEGIAGDVMRGIVRGLEKADVSDILGVDPVSIGKGETASVDEMIAGPRFGYGYDVIGAMVGYMEKDKLGLHFPQPGDVIIAFPAYGCGNNGYVELRTKLLNGEFEERSEFRSRYRGRFSLTDKIPGTDIVIGEELLKESDIYLREMASIAKELYNSERTGVVGINNTGYGLMNLNRVSRYVENHITDPLPMSPIFELFRDETGYDDFTMYRLVNNGMSFFVQCNPKYADVVLRHVPGSKVVGEVRQGKGSPVTYLHRNGKQIEFAGYGL